MHTRATRRLNISIPAGVTPQATLRGSKPCLRQPVESNQVRAAWTGGASRVAQMWRCSSSAARVKPLKYGADEQGSTPKVRRCKLAAWRVMNHSREPARAFGKALARRPLLSARLPSAGVARCFGRKGHSRPQIQQLFQVINYATA